MDKIIFKNGKAPYINDTNLNKMQENAEKAINERKPTIELLTVSDTAPSTCAMGDKYYNTTTSKIYTATATNTWGTEGENPSNLYLYADLEHKELYYYDGTDFKSYGSGKKEIGYVGEEQEGTEVILIEDSDFADSKKDKDENTINYESLYANGNFGDNQDVEEKTEDKNDDFPF